MVSLIDGQIGLVDGAGSRVRVSDKAKPPADLGLSVLVRISSRGFRTIGILVQQCRRVHSLERHKDEAPRAARSRKPGTARAALVITISSTSNAL